MKPIDDNLIARYLAGETDANENASLEKWMNAASENRKLVAEFGQILNHIEPDCPPAIPNVQSCWEEIAPQIQRGKTRARVLSFPIRQYRLASNAFRIVTAAALIIIMLGATLILRHSLQPSFQQVHTENGQRLHFTLPDGSQVRLNADSKIQFPIAFSDSTRMVHLSGEAFFEVVPGVRPFLVKTENAEVRVLGTTFNVWARERQTRVVVQTGRVEFNARLRPQHPGIVLAASQMSICVNDASPQPPRQVDSEKLLGWLENRLVFEQTPLAEIIAELQREYDVQIKLADSGLGTRTVTGSFHNQTIETILTSICMTLQLQYELKKDQYVISIKD
ncbi:MAG: FecR family protein [bacterium]